MPEKIKEKIKLKDTFVNHSHKELIDLTRKIREYEDFMKHIDDIKKNFFHSNLMNERQLLEYIAPDDQKNYIDEGIINLPYEINGKTYKHIENLDEHFVKITNGKWKFGIPIDEQTYEGRYLIHNSGNEKSDKWIIDLNNHSKFETIIDETFDYDFADDNYKILLVTRKYNIVEFHNDSSAMKGYPDNLIYMKEVYTFDVIKNKLFEHDTYEISSSKIEHSMAKYYKKYYKK